MADAVIMPKAGMAMEEGTIIRWLKSEGDPVEAGEPLLEIETDKVAMEVEAERSGVLLSITRGEGETVPVTEPIGYVGEAGEKVPSETKQGPAASPGASNSHGAATSQGSAASHGAATSPGAGDRLAATPWARTLAARHEVELRTLVGSGPHGEIRGRDVEKALEGVAGETPTAPGTTTAVGAAQTTGAVDATPVARRVAEQHGISLGSIAGSGPGGRITKEDVLAAVRQPSSRQRSTEQPAGSQADRSRAPAESRQEPAEERIKRFSSMRRTIARNMLAAHRNIPPVTLNGYAEVSRLLALRAEANTEDPENKLSVNDFVLKATIEALRRHPGLNATADMEKEEITEYGTVNLGVAVALPDGLIVPVIREAERLSLRRLSARVAELASAARDRAIPPEELAGATFTVTNLGMYGVTSFTPIINPPQVGILGVSSIEGQLVRDDRGDIVDRKIMGLSLTIDHRVVDGAQGAGFLATLRALLEHPIRFLAA
ncbi:MAG: 2-oxo acid dehydrogenase subunit E2 [Spirochaetaceae bacterium]